MVCHGRVAEPRRIRVGEAVHCTTVQVHAPVDAARAHLQFEIGALLRRDHRVVSADAHEDSGSDGRGILGSGSAEAAVEADDGAQVGARAGELERHRAAETEADRRYSRSIDPCLAVQHLQPGEAKCPSQLGRIAQRSKAFTDLRQLERQTVSVIVEREGDEPEVGEADGHSLCVVVETGPLVAHQDGRRQPFSVGER